MGNVFGAPPKPLKEQIREEQRVIKKSIRELEKSIAEMNSDEKKLIAEIKKLAKNGQMRPARVNAKSLVSKRMYVTKFIEMKAQLTAVGMRIQTVKSQEALTTAMKGVTKALSSMNKQTSIPELQKIMAEFARENERAELMQEAIGDSMDDAMAEDGDEAEEEAIVSAVMDELGLGMAQMAPDVPVAVNKPSSGAEQTEKVAAADAGTDELEARLNNLRKI